MIPIILKPVLHFLTSGIFGLLSYIVFLKITRNKNTTLLFALFMSVLLHVLIDFGPNWF